MNNPGIVVVQDFTTSEDKGDYKGYTDYMDRASASSQYSGYLKYMKNDEKSTGLFTADKDSLSPEEKLKLKGIMDMAQSKGSLMWDTIISFDNEWLEMNHLFNPDEKYLDEQKIKEYVRAGISTMLDAEKMGNAVWSAAIHYNTDNIHIHVATVEPVPMREIMKYNDKTVYRGKFKGSSIAQCKSVIANKILSQTLENQKINTIIRKNIIEGKKNNYIIEDPEMAAQFLHIFEQLPHDRRTWKYNMNAMAKLRPELDRLSKMYIAKYHRQDHEELRSLLIRQQNLYARAYGDKKEGTNEYAENKMRDLYTRLGNCILKELSAYDKRSDVKDRMHFEAHASVDGLDISTTDMLDIDTVDSQSLFDGDEIYNHAYEGESPDVSVKDEPVQDNPKSFHMEWSKAYKEYLTKFEKVSKEQGEKIRSGMKNMADRGNVLALSDVGMMYEKGIFVPIDLNQAYHYYEQAYKGFIQVYGKVKEPWEKEYINYRLGKLAYNGQGIDRDVELAFSYFKNSDISYAHYWLGKMYLNGEGTEMDIQSAISEFETAWEGENSYAAYALANIYLKNMLDMDATEANKLGVEYLIASADAGNVFAQYRLGCMYYDGNIVKKSYEKAYEYMLSASKQMDEPKIFYKLGNMYSEGLGCNKNISEGSKSFKTALKLFEKAELKFKEKEKLSEELTQNDIQERSTNFYYMGVMYLKGYGVDVDGAKAEMYLKLSSDCGNQYAQYKLGMMYLKGEGVNIDTLKAIGYLNKSAEQENQLAQYKLGMIYLKGNGVNIDTAKGIKYLIAAAAQENPLAQYQLGMLYYKGQGVEQDIKKALDYLNASAGQENQYAQYRLGMIYLKGDGVNVDTSKGIAFLKAAAAQENSFAQYQLGMIYYNGVVIKKDIQKALEFLLASADQENQYAQYRLGMMYLRGGGVNRNTSKGIEYLETAAAQGNPIAQYQLGNLYYKGEGVKKDINKALAYFTVSANQENQYAQYRLGMMYLNGEGVNIDTYKGIHYLEAAAAQDNSFAQYQLGRIYFYGNGVGRDKKKGIEYLKAAQKNGNVAAERLLDRKSHTFGRDIGIAMQQLKKSMKNEYESYINQMEYEYEYERQHHISENEK